METTSYDRQLADFDARMERLRASSQQWHLKMQFEDPEEREREERRAAEINARIAGEKSGALPLKLTKRRRGIGGSETACLGRGVEER